MNNPLISIVTVVYNGNNVLEETIQSIINQTYNNIEYIIIDGGSTDGTLDIIKKYENKISYWISEKDNGIYDAMNKGLFIARGEWINFMNAGDRFADNEILEKIFTQKTYPDITIIYGSVVDDYGLFQKNRQVLPLSKLSKGMICSHQAIFFRMHYHKNNPYNTKFKLASDYQLVYKAFVEKKIFLYVDLPIALIEIGGVSYKQRKKVIKEYKEISCSLVPINHMCWYFDGIIFLLMLKKYIKTLLPNFIINFIIRLK